MKVLLLDDEKAMRSALQKSLAGWGYETLEAGDAATALELAKRERPQAALVDIYLPDMNGIDFLEKLIKEVPHCGVIMVTGVGSAKTAVQSMKLGAFDYLEKPFNLGELKILLERVFEKGKLQRELRIFRESAARTGSLEYLALVDPAMEQVYAAVERVADQTDVTVLIHGETGVGKAHVARMVHDLSPRANKPFVEIHCGGLPEALLESELFGHEAGAFTDARRSKMGLFETAQGGTLFLDEVGELPLSIQTKLLKVLEQKTFRRLGGVSEIQLDARLVAATNRNLQTEVAAGKFRPDLFYRLNVFPILIPPLRSRPKDVELLVKFFTADTCRKMGCPVPEFSYGLLKRFYAYPWPGNVRELKNTLARILINTKGQKTIDETSWFLEPQLEIPLVEGKEGFELEQAERNAIENALRETMGNQSRAAGLLKISRPTLLRKIRKYNLFDLLESLLNSKE